MSNGQASTGAASGPPASAGDPKKNNEFADKAVKVAGVALAVSIGVSLLRSRKVQESLDDAVDGASAAAEDIDLKMKGARIVGEADQSSQNLQNNVREGWESAGKETKQATSRMFGRTKKAARQLKNARRGVQVQKGDTLWSLARKYNVSVDVIKTSNSIANDYIVPGQDLVIPGAGLMNDPTDA